MKRHLIGRAGQAALMLCLLLFPLCAAAQFVELTAEMELNDWDYWFFTDRIGQYPGQAGIPSIFNERQTRRCVVGTNTWMIETDFPTYKVTRWFTGSNIIEYTVITKETPKADFKKMTEHSLLAMSPAPVGYKYTRLYESADGADKL
jgi:hypothetical protein